MGAVAFQTPDDPAITERMRKVKVRDTVPELRVRKLLRMMGVRYRKHVLSLPGTPDVANKKDRWALFVHGCFWHHHEGCPHARVPASKNHGAWEAKFRRTRARDERDGLALEERGFRVVVVWECELKDEVSLYNRLWREIVKSKTKPTA